MPIPLSLAAFMSYVRYEDQQEEGRITLLRQKLEGEIRRYTGIKDFTIFQDREIGWGEEWELRINEALDAATLFVPILTPLFFESAACRSELEKFLRRERQLQRSDLILPIYYVDAPLLNDPARRSSDPLADAIARRQYIDWREFRFKPLSNPPVAKALAAMAQQVRDALDRTRHQAEARKHDELQTNGSQPAAGTTSQQATKAPKGEPNPGSLSQPVQPSAAAAIPEDCHRSTSWLRAPKHLHSFEAFVIEKCVTRLRKLGLGRVARLLVWISVARRIPLGVIALGFVFGVVVLLPRTISTHHKPQRSAPLAGSPPPRPAPVAPVGERSSTPKPEAKESTHPLLGAAPQKPIAHEPRAKGAAPGPETKAVDPDWLHFYKVEAGNYTKQLMSFNAYTISSPIRGAAVLAYADINGYAGQRPKNDDTILRLTFREAYGIAKSLRAELPTEAEWVNAYKQGVFTPQGLELVYDRHETASNIDAELQALGIRDRPLNLESHIISTLCGIQVKAGTEKHSEYADDVSITCVDEGQPATGALRVIRRR